MPSSDTPADVFKRALAHAARALAEQAELEVVFGQDGPKLSNGVLTLPNPPRDASPAEAATVRGQADRLALRLANHDEMLHGRLRPLDQTAAEVFEAVEQARVEAVGSEHLAGVRSNLNAALLGRLERTGALRVVEAARVPPAEAVSLLVRERLTGQRAPDGAGAMLDLVRAELETKAGRELDGLAEVANDQVAFAQRMKDVLRALDLDPGDGRGDEANDEAGEDEPPPQAPDPSEDQQDEEQEDGGQGAQSMDGAPDDDTAGEEREGQPQGAPGDPTDDMGDPGDATDEGALPNRQQVQDDGQDPNAYRVFTT
ncbi:MAG: cobaltochelatase subunit CobT, partial [Brevundimonas sp.]